MDPNETGFVSREEISDMLVRNNEVIIFFELNTHTFTLDLKRFPTKRNGFFSFKEFCKFMRT